MAGQQNNNCTAINFISGTYVRALNTTCSEESDGFYRFLSATPSHSVVVPVAPSDSVYLVNASFSGLHCTGVIMYSSIVLESNSSSDNPTTCTAPANGTCSGYNFVACPTTGLSFATITGRSIVAPAGNMSSYIPNYNKVVFRNNVCRGRKQGGTVFVVKDPQTITVLFGPQMPHFNERVVFVNNTAAVGSAITTQTTKLQSTSNHTTIVVKDYNSYLNPSLAFNLVDDFNNINTTDFSTTVSILPKPYLILPPFDTLH